MVTPDAVENRVGGVARPGSPTALLQPTTSVQPAAIAAVAALVGDTARASVLVALMGSDNLSASVLAAGAGVSASTMSQHLSKLKAAGLVECELQGRNRYYRLADRSVADVVEAVTLCARTIGPAGIAPGYHAGLSVARMCYDHLGGALGVALFEALKRNGAIASRAEGGSRVQPVRTEAVETEAVAPTHRYRLTYGGMAMLGDLGVVLPGGNRPALRTCRDWSQQASHLAGRLGAALLGRMLELRWLCRGADRRSLTVTSEGRAGLRLRLDIELSEITVELD
ncbi:MAG: helix-turn-helix transcriptional regulator [Actinomycetota bacterium]|nr:helix-turn-helix transcriptional regulator [Actinomycetota bacterium]